MPTIKRFEDMDVWQLAQEQANEVFKLIQRPLFSKDFELKKQINASSGSVMDCIAEGFERSANGEFRYFLGVAKGSNGEVRSQLYRALSRAYLTQDEFKAMRDKNEVIGKKLNGFMGYLLQSPIKGQRYHKGKSNNLPDTPN